MEPCLLKLPEHSWGSDGGQLRAWDSAESENEKRILEMFYLGQCEGHGFILAGPFFEKGLSDTMLCVLFLRESEKPRFTGKGLSSC